jgi:hypothetical protein
MRAKYVVIGILAVAVIEIVDNADFWEEEFPCPSEKALLPDNDLVVDASFEEFGENRPNGIASLVGTV